MLAVSRCLAAGQVFLNTPWLAVKINYSKIISVNI